MEPQGIGFWLTKRQSLHPHKEALVDGNRRLTYGELNQRVNRLANALTAHGLRYGDRLAREMSHAMADKIVKLFYEHEGPPHDALPEKSIEETF